MSVVQNFECCWKYSIFGRNSWILKVLAHEKSDEKKKIKILNLHGMMKGPIKYTFSEWALCKIYSVFGDYQFLVEILEF